MICCLWGPGRWRPTMRWGVPPPGPRATSPPAAGISGSAAGSGADARSTAGERGVAAIGSLLVMIQAQSIAAAEHQSDALTAVNTWLSSHPRTFNI